MPHSLIPDGKRAAVARAIRRAFDADSLDDIRPLTAGLSTALVFRVVVRGEPCVLRVITRTDVMADPTRQIDCIRTAGEAGIAPRLRYASVEDRVLISDFVEPQPFPSDMATLMASTLRTLHTLRDFPTPVMGNYLTAMDGIVRRFERAGLTPADKLNELMRGYAELTRVYPRGADSVASHNDLKPDNIVFDGRRIQLIDWESAFLNDRYLDLAVVANFFAAGDSAALAYLTTYFGRAPSEYEQARFYLMQQLLHVFYAAFLLPLAAGAGARIDWNTSVPSFDGYHHRLVSRDVTMEGAETRAEYGRVHLERVLDNMRAPRFERALARVAAEG